MMRRLLPILFFISCSFTYGQNALLNTGISWFNKTDRTTIDSYLKGYSYQFFGEKDSLDLHLLTYSLVKTEDGTQPFIRLLISDTALEFISIDTYGARGQQTVVSGLKNGRFKSIGTDINGNFITTTYENGTFLIQEDYEAVGNPLGKGEIAYFRYRIFRKYGKFDRMNGEKVSFSEDGSKVSESYKNGVLDGQRTLYFPDGTVKRTENYRAGRLNGLVSDFDENGKLTHTSTHSYHWKYGMEKWYNREGKVVKSLQWQRDIPVGTEKQTFNGQTIGSVAYVKGIKQGKAQIPVYSDRITFMQSPHEVFNSVPLGIETVTYQNGAKSGKAVCMDFSNPADTLYVGYYKDGMRDSIYTKYEQGEPVYTTAFSNDLEHGVRIFRIPSGPLKDSIYRSECYKNGIQNGPVYQYYQKENNTIPVSWKKIYREENYLDGLRHGAFIYRLDSLNYKMEHFEYDKLTGRQEYGIVREGKTIRQVEYYEKGKKTGEWITSILPDNLVITEHFDNGLKHGTFSKCVNGFKTEERFYQRDTLKRLAFLEQNGNFHSFGIDFNESGDQTLVTRETKEGNMTTVFSYVFDMYTSYDKDTILAAIASSFETDSQIGTHLKGPFSISTPDYRLSGNFNNGKWEGDIQLMHKQHGILERLFYQKGQLLYSDYKQQANGQERPYSGTFISAQSGEKISVKNGLRHGWCIEYDSSNSEFQRTKYVKGIAKKTVEKYPLPPPETE